MSHSHPHELNRPIHVWMVGLSLMVLWSGCLIISLIWDLRQGEGAIEEAARTAARTSYEKDLSYRHWNTARGPIYVPVSDLVSPSPYMPREWREIPTRTGRTLTVVHPSFIMREVNGMALQESGVRSHLTSLKPLRPENAPDSWERAALESLADGVEEVTEVVSLDGRDYLRLMRPLFAERSCQDCHPQASRIEEVRGGLSISIPMELFAGSARKHKVISALQHGILFIIGIAGIALGSRHLQKQVVRRQFGEEILRQEEERFRSIFIHAGAGMSRIDEKGRFLEVNAELCELLGYPAEKLLALTVSQLTHPKDLHITERMLEEVRAGQRQRYRYEKRFLRQDGSIIWMDVSTNWFKHSDNPIFGIALCQDITDRKRAAALAIENKEQLEYLANHDALTDLPNRRLLQERLEDALARARRNRWQVAVLFLDLDRFKTINDSLGHELGDRLICAIAVRLRALLRETDIVARFGGDEFVLVLDQIKDASDVARVAQKILKTIEKPIILGEHHLHVSASIGISLFPGDGQDILTLLQCADLAMYCAKDKGRNRAEFCIPELNNRTRDRLRMESALRQALKKDELLLHYQPQVNLASGRMIGLEALLRWQHPIRGLVPPCDFIPLAEETGLIMRMGEWVLRTACRQAKALIDQGFPPIRMAVNISARQFREGNLAATVEKILHETRLPPYLLELELTESMVMTEVEEAIGMMEDLTRLGVRLAIDDFGAGYSSLTHLRRFPIATLKIDRSFVENLIDPRTTAVTDSVIHLSKRLGLEVIAEGIETQEQRYRLARMDCQQGQGYLFGRPLPAKDIQALFEKGVTEIQGEPVMPAVRGRGHSTPMTG